MSLRTLLAELSEKNISLLVDDGRLRIRGDKNVITPELQQTIKNKKDELCAWYEKQQSRAVFNGPIQPISRNGLLPLSYAQKRLWFLDKLESHSASYNLSFLVRLEGTLNVYVLEKALNEILKRHETLRSSFSDEKRTAVSVNQAHKLTTTHS